jgi:hypothetical protein
VLPQEIPQVSGKTSRLGLNRLPIGQRQMEILDRFASGQAPPESDSLNGGLPKIESDTLGNHDLRALR